MLIDAYLTPEFKETDNQFNNSIVIMIDVLRASTTVCSALYHGAKEVIPVETTDKAVKIYSSLSKDVRFLGGERNGVKLNGFDAGNSPLEYTDDKILNKSIILTTTNGTLTFNKAKVANYKIVGGFININAIIVFVNEILSDHTNINKIIFLCAGNNGRLSFEDTLCAGAFINEFSGQLQDKVLTDTALAASDLYKHHFDNLVDFLKSRDHGSHLQKIGFEKDLDISFSMNIYPVVPLVNGNTIKLK